MLWINARHHSVRLTSAAVLLDSLGEKECMMSQDETKDYTPAAPATPREQTKQDGLRTTQQPSGLKQLISLGIPLTRFVMYPMDQIRLIGSSLKQMVGKKFDPEKDVCDQTGKVILITGGNQHIKAFEHGLVN